MDATPLPPVAYTRPVVQGRLVPHGCDAGRRPSAVVFLDALFRVYRAGHAGSELGTVVTRKPARCGRLLVEFFGLQMPATGDAVDVLRLLFASPARTLTEHGLTLTLGETLLSFRHGCTVVRDASISNDGLASSTLLRGPW